jgi:hypothetical protein
MEAALVSQLSRAASQPEIAAAGSAGIIITKANYRLWVATRFNSVEAQLAPSTPPRSEVVMAGSKCLLRCIPQYKASIVSQALSLLVATMFACSAALAGC